MRLIKALYRDRRGCTVPSGTVHIDNGSNYPLCSRATESTFGNRSSFVSALGHQSPTCPLCRKRYMARLAKGVA